MKTLNANYDNLDFDNLSDSIQRNWQNRSLFTTDIDPVLMYELYLDNMDDAYKQEYNCSCCKDFFRQYGTVAYIRDDYTIGSAIFEDIEVPDFFEDSIASILKLFKSATITGVFLTSENVWGKPETGKWRHFNVRPFKAQVFKDLKLDAYQAMTSKTQNMKNVVRALSEFKLPLLEKAVTILESDILYRSEKVIGGAKWLYDLQVLRSTLKGPKKQNALWAAIAVAPDGFCHPRSSMISTLLEDLENGLSLEQAAAKFKAKMLPDKHLRPVAKPKAGSIDNATKLAEKMGITNSFKRRFARLDEIKTIWVPKAKTAQIERGIFQHLKNEPKERMLVGNHGNITFKKFCDTVLPQVESIEIYVPYSGAFAAFTTAVDADAPPILQWDTLEERNPVAQYTYTGGSNASQWNLVANTWAPVTAIALSPWHWGTKEYPHMGNCAMLVIEGCKDRDNSTLALYPETMQSALHEIRSVIEAYSKSGSLSGHAEANACGWLINRSTPPVIRVTRGAILTTYKIDRWD